MTIETLERVRFFVGQAARKSRIAANNARLNGYKEVALQLDNEAALGDLILKELAHEKTEGIINAVENSTQRIHD